MAKVLSIAIVCLICFAVNAQHAFTPLASPEEVSRKEFALHFTQPLTEHRWEIIDDTTDTWKRWQLVENYSFGKNRGSIPMIADLHSLHPYFRDKVVELMRICRAKGIELAIVESYRTHAKQNEYKAMGRRYTRMSGGNSLHQYGMAVDIVPMINSVPQWHNIALWRRVGVVGEHLGLRWGGRWRALFDPGHFEWSGGLGPYHLAKGIFPVVPKSTPYPCLEEDLKELRHHWKAWEIEQSSVARKVPSGNIDSYFPAKQVVSQGGND